MARSGPDAAVKSCVGCVTGAAANREWCQRWRGHGGPKSTGPGRPRTQWTTRAYVKGRLGLCVLEGAEYRPVGGSTPRNPVVFRQAEHGVPAALYEPETRGERSRIAFMFMHPDSGFISHVGCGQLAERGYRALGVNSRFTNMPGPTGGPYVYHEVIPDVAAGVAYLRSLPGVDTVILAGHSGGGPLFSAYQNLAENGAARSVGRGC